jgi:flavodoxin
MKTLIVFYSRTSTTKKIVEDLARRMGADIEELIDKKNRTGAIGYIFSGKDAMKELETEIVETKKSVEEYDLLIIATPIWAGKMTPAIRTYINRNVGKLKKVAFIAIQGANPPKQESVFAKLEEICKIRSGANLHLSTKQVVSGSYEQELKSFLDNLHVAKQ